MKDNEFQFECVIVDLKFQLNGQTNEFFGSWFLIFFVILVLTDDNSSAKHAAGETKNDDARMSIGIKILIICLGVVTAIAFSVILFKIWQKKRREEQHARLLKLFEDDDELELELGLQD